MLGIQICFLWVSEDVREQNPYAGLLVLDKQKNEADKILSRAPQKRICRRRSQA